MSLHAIIPAGGAGTRLWPLSRRSHPKFLLPLAHPRQSLLTQTVARLAPMCESITLVTGEAHATAATAHVKAALAECQQLPALEVLIEPGGRNSMPAIGLAAYRIRQRYGEDALVGSFAADHTFSDPALLRRTLEVAMKAAADGGYLVTLGIEPDHPATGYGYIKVARNADAGGNCGWRAVENFVEKPQPERAAQFVREGYLWNAGIFVATVGYLNQALRRHQSAMADTLEELARQWEECDHQERASRWEQLTPIAIDYALAEPEARSGQVRVVPLPAAAGWADVGDFANLTPACPYGGQVHTIGVAAGLGYHALATQAWHPAQVFVVGLEECVVVQTPDVILVTDRAHAQQVGQIPTYLAELGLDHLQ